MNRRLIHPLALAALVTSTVLTLTACGQDDPGTDSAAKVDGTTSSSAAAASSAPAETTYEFEDLLANVSTPPPAVYVANEITVKLPDDLKAIAEKHGPLAVDHYDLKAEAFLTGICRLDISIGFAPGGKEALEKATGDYAAGQEALMHRTGVDGADAEIVDTLPSDDDLQDTGSYVTRDLSKVTIVDDCSEMDSDGVEDEFSGLYFPYIEPYVSSRDSSVDEFARTDVGIMAGGQGGPDGTTFLFDDSYVEAEITPLGKWKAPDED